MNEEQMQKLLESIFPDPSEGKNRRARIRDAGAIAAYHNQTEIPVVPILLSDDAPQFREIALAQALCWVHDARNYKKLKPLVSINQDARKSFMDKYWKYYRKLLSLKENPTEEFAEIAQ